MTIIVTVVSVKLVSSNMSHRSYFNMILQDAKIDKDDKHRSSGHQTFSTEEASRISDALYHYEVMHFYSKVVKFLMSSVSAK
jgi:hypothetical protein